MKRPVVILTIAASVLTVLYHMNNRKALTLNDGRVLSATPSMESPPPLQFRKPSNSAIATLDVWNLKPVVPLPGLKDMFKPVYVLAQIGRVYAVQRSDRPNERWELLGIAMRGSQWRALLYNSGLKKMKNAGVGELVDEQLKVHAIGSGSVTLEAKDDKKPQRFELHLLHSQKDNYAIKRKTL
ncbi:MAG: hypothetical protein WCP20_06225 [Desulfuromonadales bacterium]